MAAEKAEIEVLINGQKTFNSIKEMEQAMRQLRATARSTDDPELREKAIAQYRRLNEQVKDFNSSLRGSKGFMSQLKDEMGAFGAAVGIAFGLDQLKSFFAEGIRGFAEQEKAAMQLRNQLTIVNGEGSKAVQALEDQQEQLKGMFDDDAIRNVQLYFAQYGMGAKQIEATLPVVRDFAAATGQTLEDAAAKIIQAQNGQGRAMKEYGIVVEDTGSKAQNLANITEQLNSKFKDQADLIEGTTIGSIESLKNKWEDFKKTVGESLLGVFGDVRTTLLRVFDPDTYKAEAMEAATVNIAKGINDTLSELDAAAIAEKMEREKTALEATKRERNRVLLEERSADKLDKLARIDEEIKYYELSIQLAEKAAARKRNTGATDDLTSAGLEARKKAQEELLKFNQQTSKLLEQIEAARLEKLKDSHNAELISLIQKHEAEIAELEKQKVVKENLTADEIKRNEAVNELIKQKNEQFALDQAAAEKAIREQLAKEELAQDLKNLDDHFAQLQTELTRQRAEGQISEETYTQKQLELQRNYLLLKIRNQKDYGVNTTATEKQLYDVLIKITDEGSRKLTALNKEQLSQMSRSDLKAQLEQEQAALTVMMLSGVSMTGESAEQMIDHINALLDALGENSSQTWQKIGQGISEFGGQLSNIFSSINRASDMSDRDMLNKRKATLDKDKEQLKKQLELKLIDEATYNRRISQLDEQMEKDQKRVARDQAIRNKRLAYFNAILSTAEAIAGQLSMKPVGPWNIALAAVIGAAGLFQVAEISKTPIPELRRGKRFTGIGKHPESDQKVMDPAGNLFFVEEDETLLSAKTREENPGLVDALLDASMNNEGKLRDTAAIMNPFGSIDSSGVIDSIRQQRNMSQQVPVFSAPQASAATAATIDMADVKSTMESLNASIMLLNTRLDQGIQAKLDYISFNRDKSRLDSITGKR